MMQVLDRGVEIQEVRIGFSVRDEDLIPRLLREEIGTWGVSNRRKEVVGKGQLILPPTKDCCIKKVDQLFLTSADVEKKYSDNGSPNKFIIAFNFSPCSDDESDFSDEEQQELMIDLANLGNRFTWQARAFLNPFCNIPDLKHLKSISMDLDSRGELYGPDGKRLLMKERDTLGRKTGRKVMVEPEHRLTVGPNGISEK